MRMLSVRIVFLCLSLVVVAPFTANADGNVRVSGAWARATIIASRPAAAYMTLESAEGDQLVGVKSPVAERVMLHATKNNDGVARMVHLDVLDLPADAEVALAPGSMHLMMIGLRERLVEGMQVPITFRFERAGEITVTVPVLGHGAKGPVVGAQ